MSSRKISKKAAENVDDYIASVPEKLRGKLDEIREIIRDTAPEAMERISYGMPYYSYRGRLVYFALAKNHIGLYLPTPTLAQHKSELKNYDTSRATLRLPLDKKIPAVLIKKLIKARMKRNEANTRSS